MILIKITVVLMMIILMITMITIRSNTTDIEVTVQVNKHN